MGLIDEEAKLEKPDTVFSPFKIHPERAVAVWAAGGHFFAFNFKENLFESKGVIQHDEPIVSISYCQPSTSCENIFHGCWVVNSADKFITILEDKSFAVKERYLLPRRASFVIPLRNSCHLIVGDKFGDLFKLSPEGLRALSSTIAGSVIKHSVLCENDLTGQKRLSLVKAMLPQETSLLDEPNDSPSSLVHLDEDHESLDDPVAGHCATITALFVDEKNNLLLSGDRDEKIRIGEITNPYITHGYALGHTEFITDVKVISESCFSSIGADRTIRLWSIPKDLHHFDGCFTEESKADTNGFVPVQLEHCPSSDCLIVLCEGLPGLLSFPLVKRGSHDFSLGEKSVIPFSLCPMAFGVNGNTLFCTNREGGLERPLRLVEGKWVEETQESWLGIDIGASIPCVRQHLWKKLRGTEAVVELRAKRRRHAPKENSLLTN